MKKIALLLILFILCLFVTSCSFQQNSERRSGDIYNTYVEEPLAKDLQKWAPCLKIANQITVEIVRKKPANACQYLSSDLKNICTIEKMVSLKNTLVNYAGQPKEYLPGQWLFSFSTWDGVPIVSCAKIVKHERKEMYYWFIFRQDNPSDLREFKFKDAPTTIIVGNKKNG